MVTLEHKRSERRSTPVRFFIGLLAVPVILLLSDRFEWLPFNGKKGWTVLIAIGVVCLAIVVIFLASLMSLLGRRRFQFCLRSLLVLFVVVSLPLGWFAVKMRQARRQRDAVKAISEAGTFVFYDFQIDEDGEQIGNAQPSAPTWLRKSLGTDFFSDVVEVNYVAPTGQEFRDEHMTHLANLPRLEAVLLCGAQVTDNGLGCLRGLSDLKQLNLQGTMITDKGLAHFEAFPQLKGLSLHGTEVTDDGLQNLKGLTNLDRLNLNATAVGDPGMAHVKTLTSLKKLHLNYTSITDEGLEHLVKLKKLEYLEVDKTSVSREGAERLRRVLPNCHVDRGFFADIF